jgi:threonine aldolase
MKMLNFESDYTEGAHEKIIQRLVETNLVQQTGYERDEYCEAAREKIRAAIGCPQADIYFLVGGTQANATVIASMLGSCEGVVAAESGHINVHEAGAVEYTGHKVMTVASHDGKIKPEELKECLEAFWNDGNYEHMVFPGMVYISHPTELGTLYTKQELTQISSICHQYEIPLFLDGARLGYGLMSKETDVTIGDIVECCDAFYIGGTKVGALCGEAIVFPRKTPKHFYTITKQHGAMLAKGRLLGVQFDTLFTDDLYFKISAHAIEMAERLKLGFRERGYRFLIESPTNQQFIVMENEKLQELKKRVAFSIWEKYDETHTSVRFCTSWATTQESIESLFGILDKI